MKHIINIFISVTLCMTTLFTCYPMNYINYNECFFEHDDEHYNNNNHYLDLEILSDTPPWYEQSLCRLEITNPTNHSDTLYINPEVTPPIPLLYPPHNNSSEVKIIHYIKPSRTAERKISLLNNKLYRLLNSPQQHGVNMVKDIIGLVQKGADPYIRSNQLIVNAIGFIVLLGQRKDIQTIRTLKEAYDKRQNFIKG